MPKTEVKRRGGSVRTVTVKVGRNKYKHCEVVRKKGPRGGRTVCGPVHTKKKSSSRSSSHSSRRGSRRRSRRS